MREESSTFVYVFFLVLINMIIANALFNGSKRSVVTVIITIKASYKWRHISADHNTIATPTTVDVLCERIACSEIVIDVC